MGEVRGYRYIGNDPFRGGDSVGFGGTIRVHSKTLTRNATIDGKNNAYVAGPFEIADGVTLTVEDGATLVVV